MHKMAHAQHEKIGKLLAPRCETFEILQLLSDKDHERTLRLRRSAR